MSYDYTVIQVVCWLELPKQRRLCSIFVKRWIPINGTQQCGIGPKSTRIPRVDGLSTGRSDLGRHIIVYALIHGVFKENQMKKSLHGMYNCKTRENSIFLKKGISVISVENPKFF